MTFPVAENSTILIGIRKTWSLDSGVDCGLDCGLGFGLDFGLDYGPREEPGNGG